MIRVSRKRAVFVLLLAVFAVLAAGVFIRHGNAPRQEVDDPGPVRSYAVLQDRLDALAAQHDAASVSILGWATGNGTARPIMMLSFSGGEPVRYRVLLVGGVHGNEPSGTHFLMQFSEDLALGRRRYPGVAIDIIPVANPWGWEHGRRRTGTGRDLNRDFNSFKTEESRILRDVCARTHYDLMVDFHEDGQVSGFYLYRLANPEYALCRHVVERVRGSGLQVHHGRVSRIFHAEDGVINCALWSLRLARTARRLSVSNYFRLQGCPQAFLFETPRRLPLETRVAMHRTALEALLAVKTADMQSAAAGSRQCLHGPDGVEGC